MTIKDMCKTLDSYMLTGSNDDLVEIINYYMPYVNNIINKHSKDLNKHDIEDIKEDVVERIIAYCKLKRESHQELLIMNIHSIVNTTTLSHIRKTKQIYTNETSLDKIVSDKASQIKNNENNYSDDSITSTDVQNELFADKSHQEEDYESESAFIFEIIKLLPQIALEYSKNHDPKAFQLFCENYGIHIEEEELVNDKLSMTYIAQKHNISRQRASYIINKFLNFGIEYINKYLIEIEETPIENLDSISNESQDIYTTYKDLKERYKKKQLELYFKKLNPINRNPLLFQALSENTSQLSEHINEKE